VIEGGTGEYWEFDGDLSKRWNSWPTSFPNEVAYATFSGDGNVLVVAGDGWCGALDWRKLPTSGVIVDTGKGIDRTYVVPKSEVVPNFVVRSVGTDAKGRLAYLGARDGRIARFNLKSGKVEKVWQAFPDPVKGLAVSKEGQLLSYDLAKIKIWSRDGEFLKTID
jgi:WD40 repeat protein